MPVPLLSLRAPRYFNLIAGALTTLTYPSQRRPSLLETPPGHGVCRLNFYRVPNALSVAPVRVPVHLPMVHGRIRLFFFLNNAATPKIYPFPPPDAFPT